MDDRQELFTSSKWTHWCTWIRNEDAREKWRFALNCSFDDNVHSIQSIGSRRKERQPICVGLVVNDEGLSLCRIEVSTVCWGGKRLLPWKATCSSWFIATLERKRESKWRNSVDWAFSNLRLSARSQLIFPPRCNVHSYTLINWRLLQMIAKRNMSSPSTGDYQETICLVRCDVILQEQHSTLRNEFCEYCSRQHVLPVFDFKKKQLHLSGLTTARIEAGRTESFVCSARSRRLFFNQRSDFSKSKTNFSCRSTPNRARKAFSGGTKRGMELGRRIILPWPSRLKLTIERTSHM